MKIDALPRTFRHAIRVTREIGQRYLWIDSLCIVQDDPNDWEAESKVMGALYSMAYCTLAATSSKNSTKGFLRRRRQRQFVKLEAVPKLPKAPLFLESREPISSYWLKWRPKHLKRVSSYVFQDVEIPPYEYPQFPLYACEHIDDFVSDVEGGILNSRGWVLQERCLSRRVIHFSATQTYWQCGVGVHCETLTMMYK